MHSMQTPLYFTSKAALVSMVKSLSGLKRAVGVRDAAICPGPAHVCSLLLYSCGLLINLIDTNL